MVHRELSSILAIGIDEIQYRRGHQYLALVYQLDAEAKRLQYVAKDRTAASLNGFFDILDKPTIANIEFACTDMWPAYLKVLKSRAEESRQLKKDGYEEILKHSRWCLLKRRANLTKKQTEKRRESLKYNLKSVRGYLMREDFNRFWTYTSATWASKFLRAWCMQAGRSRIEPMQKLAKTLLKHEGLLLKWFESQGLSSGFSKDSITKQN